MNGHMAMQRGVDWVNKSAQYQSIADTFQEKGALSQRLRNIAKEDERTLSFVPEFRKCRNNLNLVSDAFHAAAQGLPFSEFPQKSQDFINKIMEKNRDTPRPEVKINMGLYVRLMDEHFAAKGESPSNVGGR
jgi:hypothetical protein